MKALYKFLENPTSTKASNTVFDTYVYSSSAFPWPPSLLKKGQGHKQEGSSSSLLHSWGLFL